MDAATVNATFDLPGLAMRYASLKHSGRYYIGPCPFCGGEDRFNLKPTTEGWIWFCRGCGGEKYHSAIDFVMKLEGKEFKEALASMGGDTFSPNPEHAERRAAAEAAEKAQRADQLDALLAQYSTAEIWEAFHRRLENDAAARQWWRGQGIPDHWQDYLNLGYTPEKDFSAGGQHYRSPAYVIPYFHPTADEHGNFFRTIQYRIDCHAVSDRYRWERGLGESWYCAMPTELIGDEVIICEGAKKAIVTCVQLREAQAQQEISVVAVPSKSSWAGIQDVVGQCGRVWVVLDPDGQDKARTLAASIGDAARIVLLPGKIDDLWNAGMTAAEWKVYQRYATKI